LQQSEIDASLLALEAEGFILRGKFHQGPRSKNGAIAGCWREFIGSRSIDCARKFSRSQFTISIVFSFAWQRADQEHRVEGLEGLRSVLEQLDGCELPLAAWESAVASGACSRLRSRMAGPALFFRSGWLGTFEHPAKFKRTSISAVADQSNRALSA